MQGLKQILLKKARIIGELKYPQRSNRESIIKYLKNIKRQEKQTQQRQKQVLETLFSLKSFDKQLLEKVYFLSFTVMKGFNKKFQFIPEQKDLFVNIVEMHYNFYLKQEAFEKAQQIKNIYRKKTMEKEILISSLLTWIYEWARRKLSVFVQKNIQSIEKDLIADRLYSPARKSTFRNENQKSNPLLAEDFSLNINSGSLNRSSFSEKINKTKTKMVMNGTNNMFLKAIQEFDVSMFMSNNHFESNAQKMDDSLLLVQNTFQLQKIDEIQTKNVHLKERSKSYNGNCRKKTIISINFNKQIFFGTFWKEMNQYYRSMNCIQDLDTYYLKTFKKQTEQKKEQLISNRIDEVIQSMLKSMPNVKKSIETYEKQYFKNCPQKIKSYHSLCHSYPIVSKQFKNLVMESSQRYSKTKNIKKGVARLQNEVIIPQKSAFQDEINKNIFKDKYLKSNVINKILQRNLSYNDTILKRSFIQKSQRQVKLPIVYNPQHLCQERDSDNQKALMIHQKFQKMITNGNRPNKGLLRYKLLNRERQKTNFQNYENVNENITYQIDFGKQHEYEMANIRKILRKREKQRLYTNKTPIPENQTKVSQVQRAILQIKVIETERKKDQSQKKTQKFEVFLSNLKNDSSPFRVKPNSKSFNFRSMKSAQLGFQNFHKQKKQDYLPKIS